MTCVFDFFFIAFRCPVVGGVQVRGVEPGGPTQRHRIRRGAGHGRDGPLCDGRRMADDRRRQVGVCRVPEEPVGQLRVARLRITRGQCDRMADGRLLALRSRRPTQNLYQREYLYNHHTVIIITTVRGHCILDVNFIENSDE